MQARISLLMILAGLPALFLFIRTVSISHILLGYALYFSCVTNGSIGTCVVAESFLTDNNTARLKNRRGF